MHSYVHYPPSSDAEAYKDTISLTKLSANTLTAYSDACWGSQLGSSVADGTHLPLFKFCSMNGGIIFKNGGPIGWLGECQDRTSLSFCEAEIRATNATLKKVFVDFCNLSRSVSDAGYTGGPLLAKLFNIVVNVVVREWMRLMCTTINNADGNLAERIAGLFAVFYVNNGYIASRGVEFLQEALDILVETFKQVGLATNTKKTQAMICTPGEIRVQLLTDSYKCMREGVAAGEELRRAMVGHVCDKALQARSLLQI
jgi:hypothetical protein